MSDTYYTGPITAETNYLLIENSRVFRAAMYMHWTMLKMICRHNIPPNNDIYLIEDCLPIVRRHTLYSRSVRDCVIKFYANKEKDKV